MKKPMKTATWARWAVIALGLCSGVAAQPPATDAAGARPAGQDADAAQVVGVRAIAPFAYQMADGDWTGISVDLWKAVAADRGWQSRWVELDSPRAQVDALVDGRIDVAVGALSLTADREAVIDFSHPFYDTHLAIAAAPAQGLMRALLDTLTSPAFVRAVGALALLLAIVGVLIWLAERRRNAEQFGGSTLQGVGNGFWWSAVTMTTVGYGDKAPLTPAGRLLATVWMFASVITISGFTAAIASSVTLDQASSRIDGVADLSRAQTLAVPGSTAAQVLDSLYLAHQPVAEPAEGLAAVMSGEADAFVYDEALLRYQLRDRPHAVALLPVPGTSQDYAFGLREGAPTREAINRALLDMLSGPRWPEILSTHLGSADGARG